MFYSSVVFVAFHHCLACPAHPPFMCFLGRTLVLVILMSSLSLVSCHLFHCLSFCAVTLVICDVDIIKAGLHGKPGMAPSCV